MRQPASLEEQIGLAERKLEARRERTLQHLRQTREQIDGEIERVKKWTPLVMVGIAGATGVALGRRRSGGYGATVSHQPQSKHAGVLAAVVAIAGTLGRAALTPQAHDLWRLWRNRAR